MEAIKPESAAILKRMMSPKNYTLPTAVPSPNADRKGSQGQANKPVPNPRPNRTLTEPQLHNQRESQAKTLPHTASVKPIGSPQRETSPTQSLPNLPTTKNSSRNSSVSSIPPSEPQNYIEPSALPEEMGSVDPSQSLPASILKQNGRPPPTVSRKKNNTYPHKERAAHPKLKSKTSSEKSFPVVDESDNQYVVMDPQPEEELPPQTLPREKPKPKPRKKITPESSPSISREASNTSPQDDDDILGDPDESDYLSIIDDRGPKFVSNSKGPSIPPRKMDKRPSQPEAVPSNIAEQLMKNFNKDQLGELISMLQLVQTTGVQSDDEIKEAWDVPSSNGPTSSQPQPEPGPENSFRGSFSECVSMFVRSPNSICG